MIFTKPDGTIELGTSGCCCSPGFKRKGMHTNSTTSWWRVNDGCWKRMVKGSHHYQTLAEAAETVSEFCDAAISMENLQR
jgi:hypothetical protein